MIIIIIIIIINIISVQFCIDAKAQIPLYTPTLRQSQYGHKAWKFANFVRNVSCCGFVTNFVATIWTRQDGLCSVRDYPWVKVLAKVGVI